MSSRKSVVIIGGGIAGLASAVLLSQAGYRVTVIEKNSTLGGRARVIKARGFTFDMGPSWYLMPEVFERFFKKCGTSVDRLFTLKKLDPIFSVYWSQKEHATVRSSQAKNKRFFEQLEKGSSSQIKTYLQKCDSLYQLALDKFLYTDFSLTSQISLLFSVIKKPHYFLGSVSSIVNAKFKNRKLQQIFSYWSIFLGASPYKLPGIYTLMSAVDLVRGVYYPMGGMGVFIAALVALGKANGVQFKTHESVTELLSTNGIVEHVVTDKSNYLADIVIGNADYQHIETKILSKNQRTYEHAYWKKKDIAPSMFLLYLGIKGRVKGLTHHNFYLSKKWEEHFVQIFEKPSWPMDPCYYVCAPSITDPSVAPKNCENLFVLVPIAPGLKDTPKIRREYRNKILSHMQLLTGEDIAKRILFEKTYAVKDFISDYNAYKGTALGLTHSLFQTALFRPSMTSKKLKNLYFTGQYTIPGTGVPMALISAELVAEKIIKKYG